MGGGIVQLSSVGTADLYLTSAPQITYFRLVYRRHTLFSMESVRQTFNGPVDFGKRATVELGRTGDLVTHVWLEVTLPALYEFDITPTPAEGAHVDATATLHRNPATQNYHAQPDFSDPPVAAWVQLPSGGEYRLGSAAGPVISTWPYMLPPSSPGGDGAWAVPTTRLRYVNNVGHALASSVELEVGGSRVDKSWSAWHDIWDELATKEEQRAGYHAMLGKYAQDDYAATHRAEQCSRRTYYVPLSFFHKHPGLALPIVALSFHAVRFNVEFRPYTELIKAAVPVTALRRPDGTTPSFVDAALFADFTYLDGDERRRFSTIPHELLIETLQATEQTVLAPGDAALSKKLTLNFNHPIKELVWVYQPREAYEADPQTGNDWFFYGLPAGAAEDEVFESCKIVLNGHDRFAQRPGKYFRLVQPYQHHTRCPSKPVHVYSFALNPEDPQPSGTCNFSRFELAQLLVELSAKATNGRVMVFALGYNVWRVAQGMAGLAFAG